MDILEKSLPVRKQAQGKWTADYLEAAQFLESRPDETLVFEDAFHAAETAKKAGFTVFGVYDDSNRENLSRMKELCDFYFDRMDIWLEDFPEKSEKK